MKGKHRATACLLALSVLGAGHAAPVRTDHVEAELVAERLGLQTGDVDNWLALRLKPDPGWHVYWQNPGDSGIATKLDWQLPSSVTAGPIQWPLPHRHTLGPLTNYGYGEETLHLVALRVAAAQDMPLHLSARAKWLVCADICIPGEAQLALDLPVSGRLAPPDPRWQDFFEKARAELPKPAPEWVVRYAVDAQDFTLSVENARFDASAELAFFPIANDLVAHAAPQRIARGQAVRLSQRLSPYFVKAPDPVEGVLVLSGPAGETAYQVRAEPGPVAPVPGSVAPVAQAELKDRKSATELLLALGLALLGGLILNLMPCVFPVLALKALSVLNSGGHSTVEQRRHALAYTAGVIGSFCAVAALLIGLRAGGQALGWGFQLQSPPFVALLAYLMFAMGLSLSGAVQFGTRWMGLGQSLTAAPGVRGSFFTGVLAVIVASPCTAPFMGPALGFALTQPAAVSLLVFFALGVGLAMPFLILGFAPGLARRLPRPGRWMETFKQAMAFPMYLTAIWLLWVLGGLTSRDGMALILVGMLLLGFGLWIPTLSRRRAARWIGYLMLALAVVMPFDPSVQRQAAAERQAGVHEPYSDARFQALRAEGRSVFVDFTADWCLTCKLNEQGALRASSVRETFAQHNVVTLMGDWTRADPAITAVLERYGRSGVPLYLASKNGAEPVVLPQVLTPSIVNDAFR